MGGARSISGGGRGTPGGSYGQRKGLEPVHRVNPFTDAEADAARRANPNLAPAPTDTAGAYFEVLQRQATERQMQRSRGRALANRRTILGSTDPYGP